MTASDTNVIFDCRANNDDVVIDTYRITFKGTDDKDCTICLYIPCCLRGIANAGQVGYWNFYGYTYSVEAKTGRIILTRHPNSDSPHIWTFAAKGAWLSHKYAKHLASEGEAANKKKQITDPLKVISVRTISTPYGDGCCLNVIKYSVMEGKLLEVAEAAMLPARYCFLDKKPGWDFSGYNVSHNEEGELRLSKGAHTFAFNSINTFINYFKAKKPNEAVGDEDPK